MYINNLPWLTILTYVGSAGVIIPVTQYLKNKLNNKTKQKVYSIVGALSALPSVVEQLATNTSWAQYLPDKFGWLFTTVIVVHAFLASPLYRKFLATAQSYRKFLEYQAEEDNTQNPAINNPNHVLNTGEQVSTPPKKEDKPTLPVLRIDG